MNSERLCIALSKELKAKLEEISSKKNISQNSVIRLAISEYIERNK